MLLARQLSLEILRQPAYVVSTLLFPAMFFWFFGSPNATSVEAAKVLLGGFSAYAVLGVVVFQLAATVAHERASPWGAYVRTLPAPMAQWLGAQFLTWIVFALVALMGVVFVSLATSEIYLDGLTWLAFVSTLLLAGLPFAGLGFMLGHLTTPKSVIPVANLVYLPLSFAGGLWIPPNALPAVVADLSPYLPTRLYNNLVQAAVFGNPVAEKDILGLIAYFIVFLALAAHLRRKYEGERFG